MPYKTLEERRAWREKYMQTEAGRKKQRAAEARYYEKKKQAKIELVFDTRNLNRIWH